MLPRPRAGRCGAHTGTAQRERRREAARSASTPWPRRSRAPRACCASTPRHRGGPTRPEPAASRSAPGKSRSCAPRSVGGERNQRHRAGALDRVLQLALVQRAGAGNAARQDLASLRDELLKHLHVFEIDVLELLDAELADALAAIEELLLAALLSARTAFTAITTAAAPRSARWGTGSHWSSPPVHTVSSTAIGASTGAGSAAANAGAGRTRSFFGFFLASLSARFRSRSVRTMRWRRMRSEFFIRRSSSASEPSLSNTKRW